MKINVDPNRFHELRQTHGVYTAKAMALKEAMLSHLDEARRTQDVTKVCDVLETLLTKNGE